MWVITRWLLCVAVTVWVVMWVVMRVVVWVVMWVVMCGKDAMYVAGVGCHVGCNVWLIISCCVKHFMLS